jgi:hypothetical protein
MVEIWPGHICISLIPLQTLNRAAVPNPDQSVPLARNGCTQSSGDQVDSGLDGGNMRRE